MLRRSKLCPVQLISKILHPLLLHLYQPLCLILSICSLIVLTGMSFGNVYVHTAGPVISLKRSLNCWTTVFLVSFSLNIYGAFRLIGRGIHICHILVLGCDCTGLAFLQFLVGVVHHWKFTFAVIVNKYSTPKMCGLKTWYQVRILLLLLFVIWRIMFLTIFSCDRQNPFTFLPFSFKSVGPGTNDVPRIRL